MFQIEVVVRNPRNHQLQLGHNIGYPLTLVLNTASDRMVLTTKDIDLLGLHQIPEENQNNVATSSTTNAKRYLAEVALFVPKRGNYPARQVSDWFKDTVVAAQGHQVRSTGPAFLEKFSFGMISHLHPYVVVAESKAKLIHCLQELDHHPDLYHF